MSRCGSCPIYDSTEYGVYCPGDYGVEECADKLQDLYYAMSGEIKSLKISTSPPSNIPLTLEELREMDGEPVFCFSKREAEDSAYGIACIRDDVPYVRTIQNKGTSSRFFYLTTYGTAWLAYRYKLEEKTE